jgi:hypothetical protein
LTAENLKNLLTALPVRVLRKIKQISKETGNSVETVVERGVELYRKRETSKLMRGDDRLSELMKDPKNRELFAEFTAAMGQRSAANANLTTEQKTSRASAGGAARASTLTPARRKEIAIKASQAANKKRAEKRKPAESGGSKPGPAA